MKKNFFSAAMYLRLSRDDSDIGTVTDAEGRGGRNGYVKSESNSIGNQRELIRAYIQGQQDIELYDIYVDDGFSGSNFDRPEFKRMMGDVEAGRVNCVIVKDLSRFGRDYIESGRYIQKVFPALGVRFIALTDHYDSFHVDAGENGIVLPVKNFINDSYCRDISTKVKSQLEVKRKNGECIAPFAPYGYRKAEHHKNQLVIDEYAAEIVRRIYEWKIDGMAVAAIADRLNGLGILSPGEYKKSTGCHYKSGFSGAGRSLWSSTTVKRILTDETYLGHLLQGKTAKVNYKVKKSVAKPKEEWIRVENAHEPVISEETFQVVQNLLKTDSRMSPVTGGYSLFAGMVFCGDCGEQMIRRVNRYKESQRVFYICSTKNRGDGCTRHSIAEDKLKELVGETLRKYANCFLEEKRVFEKALDLEANFDAIVRFDTEIARLKQEQDKYGALISGLYEDLRKEVITKEEFERLHGEFKRKTGMFEEAQRKQEAMIKELFKNGVLSAARLKTMQDCAELKEIDRHTLCSMVQKILVYEGQRVEIVFYYTDRFRIMSEANRGLAERGRECDRQNGRVNGAVEMLPGRSA